MMYHSLVLLHKGCIHLMICLLKTPDREFWPGFMADMAIPIRDLGRQHVKPINKTLI